MDFNVFIMGLCLGTAATSFFAGAPWWVIAINVFAATLNALAVFS